MEETEVAVVGAGVAGLSLAHRLALPPPGRRPVPTALFGAPPGPLRPPSRTLCYWEPGSGRFDAAVSAEWTRLRVHGPGGEVVDEGLGPLRYKMIRSDDFEELTHRHLSRASALHRAEAAVETIEQRSDGARVHGRTADGRPVTVHARWVFDSRPPGALPPARTTLLQHFTGWLVHARRPSFDPDAAVLMDFRTPQPARGLSFGYVLPTDPHHALVEYTEFSPAPLTEDAYRAALRHYTGEVLKLGEFEVTGVEHGVIPMTDARFPRRAGPSVFRIGAAGGATRPSTGYTFSAVQRQSRAIAAACRAGRRPEPGPPHSARSLAMDAVLLRALDTGLVEGTDLFTRLFSRVPMTRVLRFLDGRTRLAEDLSIGLHLPVRPMLRAVADLTARPRRAAEPS